MTMTMPSSAYPMTMLPALVFGLDPRFPETLLGDLVENWQQTSGMKFEVI
jgi:hypothetical protein